MKTLIISPHLDDSMLSLGGWILLNQDQQIDIINVFDTAWSCLESLKDSKLIYQLNKIENQNIFKKLACDYVYWDFPEALSRGYSTWCQEVDYNKDFEIINLIYEKLIDVLDTQNYSTVFFPMAIEKHTDHCILFDMLNKILTNKKVANKIELGLYEDLPYAFYVDIDREINNIKNTYKVKQEIIDISNVYKKKAAFLKMYKSQITSHDLDCVLKYSKSIVPQKYCERILWVKGLHDEL